MARAVKVLKWIFWPAVVFGCVYFVGTVYLENDELADCKLKQWWAGGKKPPETGLLSSISFQNDGSNIVADFGRLEKVWSHICLTSLYQPGSPYLSRRDSHWGGATSPRTTGCWAGDDPTHLTLLLNNRHTGENEYHRIAVTPQQRGPILDTYYRTSESPEGLYQCSQTSAAVATCRRDAGASPDYCLLYFNR
jgi:hypothetical protein